MQNLKSDTHTRKMNFMSQYLLMHVISSLLYDFYHGTALIAHLQIQCGIREPD